MPNNPDLTRALVRNNWTLHVTSDPDIWGRIGHSPCDALGASVWYVTIQSGVVIGHSQLSEDFAIEQALERVIQMNENQSKLRLSQANLEIVGLCMAFGVTTETTPEQLDSRWIMEATVIRLMYTDFAPEEQYSTQMLTPENRRRMLDWAKLLMGWAWPDFHGNNQPKFYVQLTATRAIGIQVNPDSSIIELAEAYWGDYAPKDRDEPTKSQVMAVESVYIQMDIQLTALDITQAVPLRDPDDFLTTTAKVDLSFGTDDGDV